MHRPTTLLSTCLLALSLGPVWAQEATHGSPFVEFVARPGQLELRGVLCARPLQAEHAAARGLSLAELRQRASLARVALDAYELERYVAETDEYLVRVPAGETETTIANLLLATGNFQYVEPDWLAYPIGCPNDSQFAQQWHHQANRMRSCDAWDIETGNPTIVVAICDTGIRTTHQDLQLHRYEGFNVPSQTWQSAGGAIDDVNGHGTLCTGTSAANGDNGIGVAGVGWNLGHRMLRVTDDSGGGAAISNLTLAARTAADAGDRVASVSYSGVTSSSVQTTGAYVRARDALLVWAAGNDSTNLSGNRDDSVIIVGATTSSDTLASFSNFGSLVDFTAPGASIRTTSNGGDTSYSNVSGTSFACPMVAGLCGLVWSRNPLLTPQQVEDILRGSCDDLGAVGLDDTFGYGRINSYEALLLTPPPTVAISFPNGLPGEVDPAGGTTLAVIVEPGTSTPQTNAAEFWVDTGAGFQAASIVYTGSNRYDATFPAASCPSVVRYYLEFPLVGGGAATSPLDAPLTSHSTLATSATSVITDTLEVPSGWTVGAPGDAATTGLWVQVNPVGTTAQPEDDHTLAGTLCFVTGQGAVGGAVGANDVDGGATTLTTPTLDLSASADPHIAYWRWYSNGTGGAPGADVFVVDISGDGGVTWTNVETVGPTGPGTSGGWIEHSFRVGSLLATTTQVRLRFVAADLGAGSIIEAAIDDFEVFEQCPSNCGAVLNYCTATPSSTGSPATMGASGSTSFASNDLVLTASSCPSNSVGMFAMARAQALTPLGNGNLCLGASLGPIIRLDVRPTDLLGVAVLAYDNTAPPHPSGQVAAGETWNFQFVFRDLGAGGAGFNLTDGLSVTFCP
jgi:subtilisin family serine protease